MSTQKQINANRENAQHSSGPVTPEGKAAVSQNRTIHGLNYNSATFRVLPCENQADYDQRLETLLEEENPANNVQHILVVAMAQHRWLLDRATRLQETCFDPETGQVADQKLFSLYLRYATTHERAFHKCLNDLLKIRVTEVKWEIGSESEKRRAERHQGWQQIEIMKQGIQEMHFNRAESDMQLRKIAIEMSLRAEKAEKAA